MDDKENMQRALTLLACGVGLIILLTCHAPQDLPIISLRHPYNYFVARVIFSEANDICSTFERELVASVIKNRVGHPGFNRGQFTTMEEVAKEPGAFSCVNDPSNKKWWLSISDMEGKDKKIWDDCVELSRGTFEPFMGYMGYMGVKLVYFHDKSIDKPASWNNQWWTANKEFETTNFIFYSVTKTNPD